MQRSDDNYGMLGVGVLGTAAAKVTVEWRWYDGGGENV
jgi:hypothetical protein